MSRFLLIRRPVTWASIAYNRPRWLAHIILWLYWRTPVIHTRESVMSWRGRAVWHCHSCTEKHDRNQYRHGRAK